MRMKFNQIFANEHLAGSAARLMKYLCYFAICFYVLCAVLSFMGRQAFFLHTKTGTSERAIYAEENHNPHSRSMTVSMGDDIHVWTNDTDQIDPAVQAGLSLMYAVHIIPMIFAYWFLSRVFSNINKGQIFTEQNSSYLLYYGMLQLGAAVFVPFIKLLICRVVNLASGGRMSISTGRAMLNMLIPGIAFIVAAYIIHYGVHLQDEVDHTL
jgi:hypothetical protein